MNKIIEILKSQSNDYSEIENDFLNKTGGNFIGDTCRQRSNKNKIKSKKYSVIIPSYGFTKYLNGLLVSLDRQLYNNNFEAIIVNNRTEDNDYTELYKPQNFSLKLIELSVNRGRSFARNVGLACSKGEVVSFIDSDMILPNNFIREHMIRATFSEKIVLVSLYKNLLPNRYNATLNELVKTGFNFSNNYNDDFRYKKQFTTDDLRRGYNITKSDINREFRILRDTDNFKNFGFNRKYGVWQLPVMLLTIAVTMQKEKRLCLLEVLIRALMDGGMKIATSEPN